MALDDVQKNWEEFARTDPLWSILSDDDKLGNRWDVGAFFETGRAEIRSVMDELVQRGLCPMRRCALDFGCGVGRLSQALAGYFDSVIGVDISPTMVAKATEYDVTGKVRFIVNTSPDIPDVPRASVDLVYSRIVLQHNEVIEIEHYLRTLARIVAPGGVLAFQLPTVRSSFLKRILVRLMPQILLNWRRRLWWRGGPQMLMNGVPRQRVIDIVKREGLTLVETVPDASAGKGWLSCFYYFTKPA